MEKENIKDKPAIKYFENFINKYQDNNSTPTEKIQLIFKLINAQTNYSYSLSLQNQGEEFGKDSVASDFMLCSNSSTINLLKYNCDYDFGKQQKLELQLNIKGLNQSESYPFFTTIGEIVGSENSIKNFNINNNNRDEILQVKSLKINSKEQYVTIHFQIKIFSTIYGNNIPESQEKQYFKNEVYKIYFKIERNKIILYESEVFTDDGKFNIVQIPLKLLNSNFSVIFFNYKKKYLSKIDTSVSEITNLQKRKQIFYSNQLTLNDKIEIYNYSLIRDKISFLDYIKKGVRVALDIGIDFTGSNGHPNDKNTLHCCRSDQTERNPYERAILSCANIMANYDYDQLFPVYGFGAIINGEFEASMCFNINFKDDPNIQFVDNIIKEYHKCLRKITFSGPTCFAPIINKIISDIKKEEDILEYHVLMILTDGVINDFEETVDALVEGSFLPLSVIIIGIGDADFKKMEDLDGDDKPLISRYGIKRQRDLVQFVPFKRFEGDEKKLTEEVLDEIPRQIIEYYTLNFLYPELIANNTKDNIVIESPDTKDDIKDNKSIDLFKNISFDPLKSTVKNINNSINKNSNNNSINKSSNNFNTNNNNYNQNNNNKLNKSKNINSNRNSTNNHNNNNFSPNNNSNFNYSNLQFNTQNPSLNNNIPNINQNNNNNNRTYRIPNNSSFNNSSFNNNSNNSGNTYINTPNQ